MIDQIPMMCMNHQGDGKCRLDGNICSEVCAQWRSTNKEAKEYIGDKLKGESKKHLKGKVFADYHDYMMTNESVNHSITNRMTSRGQGQVQMRISEGNAMESDGEATAEAEAEQPIGEVRKAEAQGDWF